MGSKLVRVLVINLSVERYRFIVYDLKSLNCHVTELPTLDQARLLLNMNVPFDAMLIDVADLAGNLESFVKQVKIPVIFLDSFQDIGVSLEVMKRRAGYVLSDTPTRASLQAALESVLAGVRNESAGRG